MLVTDKSFGGTLTNVAASIRLVGVVTVLADHYSSRPGLGKGISPGMCFQCLQSIVLHLTPPIKSHLHKVADHSRDPKETPTEKALYHHAKSSNSTTALTVSSVFWRWSFSHSLAITKTMQRGNSERWFSLNGGGGVRRQLKVTLIGPCICFWSPLIGYLHVCVCAEGRVKRQHIYCMCVCVHIKVSIYTVPCHPDPHKQSQVDHFHFSPLVFLLAVHPSIHPSSTA